MSRKSTSRRQRQSRNDSSKESHFRSLYSEQDGYRFSLVNGQVRNLQEYDDGRWKNERIDRNESWIFDGTNLIQRESKRYGTEVTVYSDPDRDGVFAKVSEVFNPVAASMGTSLF